MLFTSVTCTQGIIYLDSHRTLRIEFGALGTNCKMQSKKVRIKKIVRRRNVATAHRTSRSTAIIISNRCTPLRRLCESGPISAHVKHIPLPECRRTRRTRYSTAFLDIQAVEHVLTGDLKFHVVSDRLTDHPFLKCIFLHPATRHQMKQIIKKLMSRSPCMFSDMAKTEKGFKIICSNSY